MNCLKKSRRRPVTNRMFVRLYRSVNANDHMRIEFDFMSSSYCFRNAVNMSRKLCKYVPWTEGLSLHYRVKACFKSYCKPIYYTMTCLQDSHPIHNLSSTASTPIPASTSSLDDFRPVTPVNCLYIRQSSNPPSPPRPSRPQLRPKLSIVIPQSRILQSLIVADKVHPPYHTHPYLSAPFDYDMKSNSRSLDRDRGHKTRKPCHISMEYSGRDIMEVDLERMSYAAKCVYSRQSKLRISTILSTLAVMILMIFLICISLTSGE